MLDRPSSKVKGTHAPNKPQEKMASQPKTYMNHDLTDEEKNEIRELFFDEMVPKLRKLDARLGTISCEFAGPQYAKWMIQFRSRGEGFEIVDFEWDEQGSGIDLDL